MRYALLFVLLVGCSSSGPNTAIAGQDDFCRQLADTTCRGFVDCCAATGVTADFNRCNTTWLAICQDEFAVKPGTAYDPAAGAACVAELRVNASKCGSIKSSACDHVIVGALPIGADCTHGGKCATSATNPASCLPLLQPGAVCTAHKIVNAGESCAASDVSCADGLQCDFAGTQICKPFIARGEPCRANVSPSGCADGLLCDDVSQTCVDPGVEGTACTGSWRCADPLTCGSTKMCQQGNPIGGACAINGDCLSQICSGGRCQGPTAKFCQDFNPFTGGT